VPRVRKKLESLKICPFLLFFIFSLKLLRQITPMIPLFLKRPAVYAYRRVKERAEAGVGKEWLFHI